MNIKPEVLRGAIKLARALAKLPPSKRAQIIQEEGARRLALKAQQKTDDTAKANPEAQVSNRTNWIKYGRRLAWTIAIVVYIFTPVLNGWFWESRIHCTSCIEPVLIKTFTLFGYAVFGPYLASFAMPTRPSERQISSGLAEQPYVAYREDFQSNTLLFATIFSVIYFCTVFNFDLYFL
ncbi:hypothetical protein [Actimicrobium antarcticum]|uniref:hypothetical protein n=1 Tax=Actimicrobium antarcticum TaxID=1051899 RepID=UPI0031DF7FF2